MTNSWDGPHSPSTPKHNIQKLLHMQAWDLLSVEERKCYGRPLGPPRASRAIVGPFLAQETAFLMTFGRVLGAVPRFASPLSTSYNVFMNLLFVWQSEQPSPWREHLKISEVRSQ